MFDIKWQWKALTHVQLCIPPPKLLLLQRRRATLFCSSPFHQNWVSHSDIAHPVSPSPPPYISFGQWSSATACVLQAEGWCPPDPVPGDLPLPQHFSAPHQWWEWPRVLAKTLVFGDLKSTMKMPSIVRMLGSSRSWWAGRTAFSLWNVADESHGQRLGSLTAVKSGSETKALRALGMGTWEQPRGGNAISAKVLVPGLEETLSNPSQLPLSSGCSAWDLLNEAKPEIVLTECLSWNSLNKIVVFLCSLLEAWLFH